MKALCEEIIKVLGRNLKVGGEIMIETERLILRPFQKDNAEDLYEYLHEPMVHCFASMRLKSLDEAREEVAKRVKETEYLFAIVLKENSKVIGEIDAYPESGEPHKDENAVANMLVEWKAEQE